MMASMDSYNFAPSLPARMQPFAHLRRFNRDRCDPFNVSFYTPQLLPAPYLQCLRPYADKLSVAFRGAGHWEDCDELPQLWDQSHRELSSRHKAKAVFVDVGANIGSCSLLMLAKGVKTVAFEPLPANRMYLAESVRRNSFSDLLQLHAVALGSREGTVALFSSPTNAGNTVVEHPIGDDADDGNAMRRQRREGGHTTRIVTLDQMLWPDPNKRAPVIPLLKLDAQGYEVQVLRGAVRLLQARAIRAIKVELAVHWLHAQNSSAQELVGTMIGNGFEVSIPKLKVRAGRAAAYAKRMDVNVHPLNIVDCVATLKPP